MHFPLEVTGYLKNWKVKKLFWDRFSHSSARKISQMQIYKLFFAIFFFFSQPVLYPMQIMCLTSTDYSSWYRGFKFVYVLPRSGMSLYIESYNEVTMEIPFFGTGRERKKLLFLMDFILAAIQYSCLFDEWRSCFFSRMVIHWMRNIPILQSRQFLFSFNRES